MEYYDEMFYSVSNGKLTKQHTLGFYVAYTDDGITAKGNVLQRGKKDRTVGFESVPVSTLQADGWRLEENDELTLITIDGITADYSDTVDLYNYIASIACFGDLNYIPKSTAAQTAASSLHTYASTQLSVVLNGKTLSFDQPPINRNGRILLPVRAIAEAMGREVLWSPSAKAALIGSGDSALIIPINSSTIYKANSGEWQSWGKAYADVPAQILNGRTLLPLRVFCESLGAQVNWDADRQQVTITGGTDNSGKINDAALASINTSYYLMNSTGNPFSPYSEVIEKFHSGMNNGLSGVAIALADPWRCAKDLFGGKGGMTDAQNAIASTLCTVLSEMPGAGDAQNSEEIARQLKIIDIIKGIKGSGESIVSGRDYVIGKEERIKALEKAEPELKYLDDFSSTLSDVFDLSVVTVDQLVYFFSDYSNNMRYLDTFTAQLREAGINDEDLNAATAYIREIYTNKFVGFMSKLADYSSSDGIQKLISDLTDNGAFGLGNFLWKESFAASGLTDKAEALNSFCSILCYNGSLDTAYEAMQNRMKSGYTADELAAFQNMTELERATKISAYNGASCVFVCGCRSVHTALTAYPLPRSEPSGRRRRKRQPVGAMPFN